MAALLEGKAMSEALVLGSAAGALAVTRAGAASSIPERDAVLALTPRLVGTNSGERKSVPWFDPPARVQVD